MGTKHKILEDFYDEWFVLIALHCNQEDHALAYAINSTLKTRFKRSKQDVDMEGNFTFPMFEWFDEKTDSNWSLFPNGTLGQADIDKTGLFKDMPSSAKHHLVPEYKEVDFFIKSDYEMAATMVKGLHKIPEVITAYTIDCEKLNSKNNLIF